MPQAPAAASLAERAKSVLMGNYGDRDLAIVRGRGARCWDQHGNEHLDFLAGIAVNNAGHCHPAVVEAIERQARELIHCSNAFLVEPQIELAERLVAKSGLAKAFFCNTGAEATEAAIKLARLRTRGTPGKSTVLCFENSFHGRTYGAMSATWSRKVREGFEPLAPGFEFARFNDLEHAASKFDDSICAVLVETIQGEGGIHVATPEFLAGLRALCDKHDALLITDEIQCGIARSGKAFAYQHGGVSPDLVPIAKALGGGLPIGALLAAGHCADVLVKGSHGSTFGGNPVACAAGLAACDLLFDDAFLAEVGRKGCMMWGAFEELKNEFPEWIEGVRGLGLMQGLVLRASGMDFPAIGRRHGLLFNCTADRVLRFLPPLVIDDADIAEMAEKLRACFREAGPPPAS